MSEEILPFGRMRKLDVAEKFFLPNGTLKTQMNTHQNISDILDNLLSGYDNRIRPDFGGPPAVVEVDIMVRSMGPISEIDMVSTKLVICLRSSPT
ncbi:hypothetical protein RUM43_012409 [Polyplax serrata]|uniref:Uncharacterized protein n=1 Tax=Polyplax serrata TaxID=468196 RepID=A0AAN8PDL3_POLSC